MKADMKAILVYQTSSKRFYKLSTPIKNTAFGSIKERFLFIDRYSHVEEWDLICISYAKEYKETLVFLASCNKNINEYDILSYGEIEGRRLLYEDEIEMDDYFLSKLARANNFNYAGIENMTVECKNKDRGYTLKGDSLMLFKMMLPKEDYERLEMEGKEEFYLDEYISEHSLNCTNYYVIKNEEEFKGFCSDHFKNKGIDIISFKYKFPCVVACVIKELENEDCEYEYTYLSKKEVIEFCNDIKASLL